MSLSDRLKSAMAARKITVADLLERTEISKAGLYFILDGTTHPEKVRFQTIHGICKALQISPDWLVFGFGDMETGRGGLPSQGLRIDSDTVRGAQVALRAIAQVQGLPAAEIPDWVNDPERLAMAIDCVLTVKAEISTGGNIIDLMAKIADRIRQSGGGQ